MLNTDPLPPRRSLWRRLLCLVGLGHRWRYDRPGAARSPVVGDRRVCTQAHCGARQEWEADWGGGGWAPAPPG